MPYVVVSADAHAAPDTLDDFLSYVDPVHREEVAAFGDLSSIAIPMFGGVDPGEIDDPDAVRAVATRRLAGMGVDTDGARTWLARYGTDWVFPSDAGGRRLAYLEEQGIHAEVAFPGPVLAGGLSPAMYLGGQTSKGLEPVVARPARLQPLAGRVLRRCPRAAHRVHPDRPPRHGAGGRGDRLGAYRRPLRRGDAAGHVDQVRAAGLRRRLLRTALGARARTTTWWSTCTPGRRAPPPTPSSSTTPSTAASSGSTRCSSSPGARSGSSSSAACSTAIRRSRWS